MASWKQVWVQSGMQCLGTLSCFSISDDRTRFQGGGVAGEETITHAEDTAKGRRIPRPR